MGDVNIQMVSKVLGINEVTQGECLKLEEGLKAKISLHSCQNGYHQRVYK